MQIKTQGRVSVPIPGTPVPLSTVKTVFASKLLFQVIPGLTGKTYAGATALNKTTLAGVARVLCPNASGSISETFYIESQDGEDSIRIADYAIDADVAGEGLLVTYWTE